MIFLNYAHDSLSRYIEKKKFFINLRYCHLICTLNILIQQRASCPTSPVKHRIESEDSAPILSKGGGL